MNTRPKTRRPRLNGIMIIEMIVYIALFFIISGVAYSALYSCWDASKAFRRNTDDISNSLQAGERWRADIRAATGPIQAAVAADGSQTVRIPQSRGEIVYAFADSQMRRTDPSGGHGVLLARVKSSQMQSEPQPWDAVWRWEIELQSSIQHASTRPLFTFEAVTAQGASHAH